jgi:hypothetical protein
LNFNCVILEIAEVTIGDGTQIGPGEPDPGGRPSARRGGASLRP